MVHYSVGPGCMVRNRAAGLIYKLATNSYQLERTLCSIGLHWNYISTAMAAPPSPRSAYRVRRLGEINYGLQSAQRMEGALCPCGLKLVVQDRQRGLSKMTT